VVSPITGQVTDFVHLLGGVRRNASGYIVSAETILINFLVNNSVVEEVHDEGFNIFGNKEWVSAVIHRWEGAFSDKMRELQADMLANHNITLFYSASRSFFDVSDELWAESMLRLAFGFVAMFIYLQFVLMNYRWLEIRVRGAFLLGWAVFEKVLKLNLPVCLKVVNNHHKQLLFYDFYTFLVLPLAPRPQS
jgi:hypothetical protein